MMFICALHVPEFRLQEILRLFEKIENWCKETIFKAVKELSNELRDITAW